MRTANLAALTLLATVASYSLAYAQPDMRIDQIRPPIVQQGESFEILGAHLGNPFGEKVVFVTRLIDGRPTAFVRMQDVMWINPALIRVAFPSGLPSGRYLVVVEADASQLRGRSNMEQLTVQRPQREGRSAEILVAAWPSMVIENIEPAGETLVIQGRNLGSGSGPQTVTLHRTYGASQFWHERLDVLSWNGERIQARLPARLDPGEYFVTVRYDATCCWGSNSHKVTFGTTPNGQQLASLPDLFVTEYVLEPSPPVQGRTLSVRVGVYNGGNHEAGPFTVQWWAGENSAEPACAWNVTDMKAHGGRVLTCTYEGYSLWYAEIPTRIVIDPAGTVAESNEGNNEGVRRISVRPR
jgi:hypothetical protein